MYCIGGKFDFAHVRGHMTALFFGGQLRWTFVSSFVGMAMSRKPLSVRDNGPALRKEGEKRGKRPRYLFNLIPRGEIISTLKANILKPSTSLSEDDLLRPTVSLSFSLALSHWLLILYVQAEKVQELYFNCLEFVFGVKPEALKMVWGDSSSETKSWQCSTKLCSSEYNLYLCMGKTDLHVHSIFNTPYIRVGGGGASPWSLLVSYATALHYLLHLTSLLPALP